MKLRWSVSGAAGRIVAAWLLLAGTLLLYRLLAGADVPLLADSDDAMRVVTATDLLAGQSFQDSVQVRDNAPFGTTMHWSRLVDLPIAALIGLLAPLAASAAPDWAAIAWPLLLWLPLLALSAALCARLLPDGDDLPPLALPALSLVLVVEFLPGRVDHHNVQVLLTLLLVLFVLNARESVWAAVGAGLTGATSLAVGLETLPLVALAGAVLACRWAAAREEGKEAARAFAGGLGGGLLLFFLVTTPAAQYSTPACDAVSTPVLAMGLFSGCALVLATVLGARIASAPMRLLILLALTVAAGLATGVLFPFCLQGPYAALDADVAGRLLPEVAEMQGFGTRLLADPATALAIFLPLTLALAVTLRCAAVLRGAARGDWLVLLLFLTVATAVALVQLRGARLAAPLALPAAAMAIHWARARVLASGGLRNKLGLAAVWLAFAGLMQLGVAHALLGSARPVAAAQTPAEIAADRPGITGTESDVAACFGESNFAPLAQLPQGVVLAPLRLGAHILRYTPHSVVSAGFHRNVQGTRDVLSFFGGAKGEQREIVERRQVRYLVLCGGNSARLPGWLQNVSAPGAPLQIFAVKEF